MRGIPENPYKKEEYDTFIKMAEDGMPIESWRTLANDLGISPDTLTEWKKTPRYIDARRKSMQNIIDNMTKAGKKDWRMWQYVAKLGAVDAPEQQQIQQTMKIIIEGKGDSKDISEIA